MNIFAKEKILHFRSLDSTNNRAKELLKTHPVQEGTIIKAYEQKSGRGYSGNFWESEPGKNITISCILKPLFLSPQFQFRLTMILSIAVRETVEFFLRDHPCKVHIKWPNDIYVDNLKIAGILIENNIMADMIREAICGIGFNVNQMRFVSDAPNPVSLKMITGKNHTLDEVLDVLRENFNNWYNILKSEELSIINESYHSNLYRLGELASFENNAIEFKGIITGTDPYGRLLITDTGNRHMSFDFKEVAFL